jgi:sugar (pentulose or hexulose) kinase
VRVAGLDVGGSAVKAWVADLDRPADAAVATVALPVQRPAAHRVELDVDALESACRAALREAVDDAGGSPQDLLGLTVSSMRQAFVLLDADGLPVGPAVLNSDRRGGPFQHVLAGTHDLTGHWPAPELTLPKLLAVQADEPERWAATRRVLFVHDWLLWRLCGAHVTEASYACAGGMADVAARTWASSLLDEVGVGTDRLAPVVEAGDQVGELLPGWPLPAGLPVVAGCGDTQLAALGVGGLADGVVTVVAGSSTPVIASSAEPVHDPLGRPWVSTHAARDRWALEGNAGYPGTASGWWQALVPGSGGLEPSGLVAVTAAPYWSQATWSVKPPTSLVGLQPDTTAGQVRTALLEAHAYAVRGNVEDLERVLGRRATAVVVTGGAAADGVLPALLAEVLGRDVHHGRAAAAAAGAHLVARSVGAHSHAPGLPRTVLPAGDPGRWEEPYRTWVRTTEALRSALAD